MIRIIFILACLTACASKKSEVDPKVTFNNEMNNPVTLEKARALTKKLNLDEKKILLMNYVSFYQRSLSSRCGVPFQDKPLAGITRLNIPPVDFQATMPDYKVAETIDLSTESDSTKASDMKDATGLYDDRVNGKPVKREHYSSVDIALVRMSSPSGVQYMFCRKKDADSLCANDFLIGKLANINDTKIFCDWAFDDEREYVGGENSMAENLLNILIRLQVI